MPDFDLLARYLPLAARKPALAVPDLTYEGGRWWRGAMGDTHDATALIIIRMLEALPAWCEVWRDDKDMWFVADSNMYPNHVKAPTLDEALILFHETNP
jgi:hypothetical protein